MWFSSLWHVFSLSLMFSFVKNFYVQGISDVKSKESFTITHEGICCNICYAPWKAIVLRKWMVKKKGQIIIMENTKKCIQCASDTFNKKVCQWKAGSHIFFLKCVWISVTLMQHGDRSWTFSLMPLSPGWCLWQGATALEVELLMVVSAVKLDVFQLHTKFSSILLQWPCLLISLVMELEKSPGVCMKADLCFVKACGSVSVGSFPSEDMLCHCQVQSCCGASKWYRNDRSKNTVSS